MKRILKIFSCTLLILALCLSFISCGDIAGGYEDLIPGSGAVPSAPVTKLGELSVHFIDVDQADCALIMDGDKVMLIDTGDSPNDEHKSYMLDYLEERGVKTIDYLILTHSDADHIGGAPEVIHSFNVINCIMPAETKTTKVFERTLDALEERNVNVLPPVPGEVFTLKDARFEILAPISADYRDSNNWSVVLRLDYGEKSILFTGDAEDVSEEEMVARYQNTGDLAADVLKVGHHGSNSSTTQDFLSLVSPQYAVISCGVDNKYDHPRPETLERLASAGVTVFRTDLGGTIVLVTDGASISLTEMTKEHKASAKN